MKKPTPEQLELLNKQIEARAAELQAGEAMMKDLHSQIDNLQQECQRLASIRDQRANEVDNHRQAFDVFYAAASMVRNHYGPEVRAGLHANLQLKHVVSRYMNRERNLMLRNGWRYRLARWLVKDTIDNHAPRPSFTPPPTEENNYE